MNREILQGNELSESLKQSLENANSQAWIKIEAQNLTWTERCIIRRMVDQLERERGSCTSMPLQYDLNFGIDQYVHIVNALAEENEKEE